MRANTPYVVEKGTPRTIGSSDFRYFIVHQKSDATVVSTYSKVNAEMICDALNSFDPDGEIYMSKIRKWSDL